MAKLILKIFYGTIVVENQHHIPGYGYPCIICPNHDNSLTDALIIIASFPLTHRSMLRLITRSTYFSTQTFVSFVIKSIGALPIKRRMDFPGGPLDNSDAMKKVSEALEAGDTVCLFPQGITRYHPSTTPLKTGVARIVSHALTRNSSDASFGVSIVPCSITYMNRQYFRSDVLVRFHQPMRFTPKDNPELLEPVEFDSIRALTGDIKSRIESGTLHAPSWSMIRGAKMAAQMYSPIGTKINLGYQVRIVKVFLEAFNAAAADPSLSSKKTSLSPSNERPTIQRETVMQLCNDLKDYKDELWFSGIPDYRILRPLNVPAILVRIAIRLPWTVILLACALPGLVFWLPIFYVCYAAAVQFRQTGPRSETEGRLAHVVQLRGFFAIHLILFGVALYELARPSGLLFVTPLLMWVTLRWMEDGLYSLHALIVLSRILLIDPARLDELCVTRATLRRRVLELALHTLGLPADPNVFIANMEQGPDHHMQTTGMWKNYIDYFSLLRRRKRDWSEVFGMWKAADAPEEEFEFCQQ